MRRPCLVLLPLAILSLMACTAEPRNPGPTDPGSTNPGFFNSPATADPGQPISGLTAAQARLFGQGFVVFNTEFTPATGLGPLFNSTSCQECHEAPAVGGGGDELEIQQTAYHPPAACDALGAVGGAVVQQQATPALQALLNITKEPDLPGATGSGSRVSPPLFGLGLLDAVPEAAIRELAAINRGDGVHGHPNVLKDGRIGRFGRKAATATLAEFGAGAFINEMGVTDPVNPVENSVAGQPLPAGADPAHDPELEASGLAATIAFMRFLAPVAPAPLTAQAASGKQLFAAIKCTSCHVPTLATGPNSVAALSSRRIDAYTDLLLHDMGSALADICMESAEPGEFRTQPLMGERFVEQYLHDGRAKTVAEAIEMHGGEASVVRDRYLGLSPAARAAIVAFVQSL